MTTLVKNEINTGVYKYPYIYIYIYIYIYAGEGHGNPLLQYSCLENPMDREAWRATLHGVAKSWTQLSD